MGPFGMPMIPGNGSSGGGGDTTFGGKTIVSDGTTWVYDGPDSGSAVDVFTGITWVDNGNKFIASIETSGSNNSYGIYEFSTTTAYSAQTADISFSSNFLTYNEIADADFSPQSIIFNSDGSKGFFIEDNELFGFDMSTNYDISTATGTGHTKTSLPNLYGPKDVKFNSDGTKMFVADISFGTPTLVEYSLSSAYDVTTRSQTTTFDPSTNANGGTTIQGIHFNSDGTKMWAIGSGGAGGIRYLYEYDLSTGFDLTTMSYNNERLDLETFAGIDLARAFTFDNDYYRLYIADGNDGILTFKWGTAPPSGASPDMSTASYASNFDTANETTAPMGLEFNGDGSKLFVIDESTRKIYRYSTPTAYSIASASYDSVNYDFSATTTALNGFAFNGDGTSFYIVGNDYGGSTPDTIFQFDMSTGYDIANASYSKQGTTNNGSGSAVDNSPEKIIFNNDGTKVYISGRSTNKVHQFSLSSAYDISTISYDSVDLSIGTNTNYRSGMQWGHDGKTLYILDGEGASPLSLDLYTFTTGYDVTTGSYDSTIDVSGNGLTRPQGLVLHPDGTNFIIIDGHKTFATAKAFEFTTSAIGGGGGGGGAASYFGNKALFAGSSNKNPGQIDTLDITTVGNATNFGSLGRYVYAMAAMSNGTRAVLAGGDNNTTDIVYVTFATYSTPATFGSTLATGNSGSFGGVSDGTYGVYPANSGYNGNSLEYITIATTSNGTDFGDMFNAADRRGGASDGTYGLLSGGRQSSMTTATDRFTIATPGNATDFGDNTLARMNISGMGDGTYAVFAGGLYLPQPYQWYNNIDYFTIATPGNATDFGDLVTGKSDTGATNNATRGVIAGGTGSSWQERDTIDYITIATPSNATSFGNLPTTKAYPSGTSGT